MQRILSIFIATIFGFSLALPALADDHKKELNKRIDAAVKKIQDRELIAGQHTPWVIMHAVIAHEQNITVTDPATDKKYNAIEFLMKHAKDGDKPIYQMSKGVPRLRTRGITPGFRKSFIMQDHVDQFLMAYADAGTPLKAELIADDGKTYTVKTLLDASKREFRPSQELGWTLVAWSTYLSLDETWETAKGRETGIADLVALAVERDANRETEGGPHHLYGIAFALNEHTRISHDKELEGPWLKAREYLDKHVKLAKEYQLNNGSFSRAMFRASVAPGSPRSDCWATGHMLEWLCMALNKEQLQEGWVIRGVEQLVKLIEEHEVTEFSDGGLYHAAHALRLWRQKTHEN